MSRKYREEEEKKMGGCYWTQKQNKTKIADGST
jgi:hypothetical protein